jgi:Helix-turn-helix domain
MSQSINIRAVQWAYDQNDLGVTGKAVLLTFAMHANQQGYSYPGVEFIASTWGMDRATVRRQIKALLVRRKISRTKQRRGATGQVKVYRLPRITYESGGKCRPFENHESGSKARRKGGISGGKFTPNNDNNKTTNKYHDAIKALGGSMPSSLSDGSAKSVSSFFEGYQNQNQPVQSHVKWPEFVEWCGTKSGTPTEKGFWTWLRGQRPQWRNKVKERFEQNGYVFDGKFLTTKEAERRQIENPELFSKFRRAIKRGDKINVIDVASGFTQ